MNSDSLSGFLLIDKPAGISSFDVIRQLRRQTGIRTFGHAGTLDPFATGLMILAVNNYTRLLTLFDDADKSYVATMMLGKSSSTGDPEGEITSHPDIKPDETLLRKLPEAVLKISVLAPPIHSAIKVDGKRAYELARAKSITSLPDRPASIYKFAIPEYQHPILQYSCRVSKGTYIRSLSLWLAEFLGTVGYTLSLRRTAIGDILVEKAAKVDEITAQNLPQHLLSVLDILPELQSVVLEDSEMKMIRQGRKVAIAGTDVDKIVILDNRGNCHGIGYRKDGFLCPKVNL